MEEKARKTIAIIIGNSISAYSAELMEGFQAGAREEDVNLVFLTGPHLPRAYKEILTESFSWDYEYQFHTIYNYVHYLKPDAIIVAYGLLSAFKYVPNINEFVKQFEGIPYLVLGDRVEDPKVPYLTGGNYSGMRSCIEHLINEHGYKKIGFVAGPKRNYDSNQRLQVYKEVLADYKIPVEESLIVYGNYSDMSDKEVEALLDNNPGIEAIVFANDNMAKAGYRVCAERNLIVGRDIAITGYDDTDMAKIMQPPLTSVAHNSFLFSYTAVKEALKLCRGEKTVSRDLEAKLYKRASCGCGLREKTLEQKLSVEARALFIKEMVAAATEELFSSVPHENDRREYSRRIELYFSDIADGVFKDEWRLGVDELITKYLVRICENRFVSKSLLAEVIDRVLQELTELTDRCGNMKLMAVRTATRQYIHAEELRILRAENRKAERKNWFVPIFTMDLMYGQGDLKGQMTRIMTRLRAMDVKSSYLFFFLEDVKHKEGEPMAYPDTIYLTAHYDEQEMVCYSAEELVAVPWNGGFTEYLPKDRAHFYTAFPIFSGEEQYGMILCEADSSEYMFTLICSMQLGLLHRIIGQNIREQKMKQELEEKNRILSLVSAYDELSRLLNRRGFMEKAIKKISESRGKQAFLVFADIDHLKEINDTFGHAAGDFAIRTAADYLCYSMPEDALIARIGGDEYVALVVSSCENRYECAYLKKRLEHRMEEFNKNCGKPFYVEMSAGIYEFTCKKDTDISAILKQSDEVLYEQKKKRRTTIRK